MTTLYDCLTITYRTRNAAGDLLAHSYSEDVDEDKSSGATDAEIIARVSCMLEANPAFHDFTGASIAKTVDYEVRFVKAAGRLRAILRAKGSGIVVQGKPKAALWAAESDVAFLARALVDRVANEERLLAAA